MINRAYTTKERGAAMMLFVMIFMVASIALTYSISRAVYAELLQFRLAYDSKQSYYVADAALEDMAYRYIAGMTPDATEVITINDAVATTTSTYDTIYDMFLVVAEAVDNGAYRTSALELYTGSGASFNFGVQTGNGGFELTNGSSVVGNVFSNGYIEKTGGGTATIYGDAISAGPTGLIKDAVITGNAWANTIEDSNVSGSIQAYTLDGGVVGGGAEYYQKIGGAVVNGSPEVSGVIVGNEDPVDLPISDADIELMKQDIIDNGTVIASTSAECSSGEYEIDTDSTLGMVKIECNFKVTKKGAGTTLTLDGPIWVAGNASFKSGPDVVADSSIGNRTVPFIVDNEANRATSSKVVIENGTTFTGTGLPKSYILVLSQNEDAENGAPNNVDAITLEQSSTGDLLVYAAHGRINLANSIELNEVTGYKIRLGNNADVIYESGLVNTLFTSGPGGGYTIGAWTEVE